MTCVKRNRFIRQRRVRLRERKPEKDKELYSSIINIMDFQYYVFNIHFNDFCNEKAEVEKRVWLEKQSIRK